MADLSDEIQPSKANICQEPISNCVLLTCLTCSLHHRCVQHQVHRPPRVGHAPDVSHRLDTERNRDNEHVVYHL